MANRELKYAFRVTGEDLADGLVFSSVNDAKTQCKFDSNWDFSKGTPGWTLEDSDRRLVLTWVFTDAEADDQLAVHTSIKNNDWAFTARGTPDNYSTVREVSQDHYKAWNKVQS